MKRTLSKSAVLGTVIAVLGLTQAASTPRQVSITDRATPPGGNLCESLAVGSVMLSSEGGSQPDLRGWSRLVSPIWRDLDSKEALSPRTGEAVGSSFSGDALSLKGLERVLVPSPPKGEAVSDCTGEVDGTPCDDGNACTLGETCQSGNCLAPVSVTQAEGSPAPTGTQPFPIVAVDLNGDGRLDLAVANFGSDDVTILLGDGSGGFTQAGGSPAAVGARPDSIAVGDVNGDGKLDLVTTNSSSDDVTILLGDGSGAFSQSGSPVAVGATPTSITVGDLNGDHRLDLAVANALSDDVTILLGNGTGGFSHAVGSPVAVGVVPQSLAAGDLDGDGKLDLAVANFVSSDVTILLGNGSGGFGQAAGSPIAVGTNPVSVAVGDVNLDGRLDLAVANFNGNNITILLGDGSGGFVEAVGSPFVSGDRSRSVKVADLNGDGKPDLAVANQISNDTAILLGNGSGQFGMAAGSPVGAGAQPLDVAVGDLDGDGKPDLAVANYGSDDVTILLNSTTFAPEGASCSDDNACTASDTCSNGACVAGPPTTCDDGNVCTDDSCDPASGCAHTSNAVPCSDGDACTEEDKCADGICHGGLALDCDDNNPCTTDSCDRATGCSHGNDPACATNHPPDCRAAVASPGQLWPPNHQFVAVSILGLRDPDGGHVTATITGIRQDEPIEDHKDGHGDDHADCRDNNRGERRDDHGAGHGDDRGGNHGEDQGDNTCPDAQGVGSGTALVRAELSERGDGRVYHVAFSASDGMGGACSGVVLVRVPRDRHHGHACIDEGPLFDSTGPCTRRKPTKG